MRLEHLDAEQRVAEAASKLMEAEDLTRPGPESSRLRLRLVRELAKGRPLAAAEVETVCADLGISPEDAQRFLGQVADRDAEGNVVGIMGLSLKESPHRFSLDGVHLFTWCAVDTLFLPAWLRRTATVESASPVSGTLIRLTVSPERVEAVAPPGAVVSMPLIDPDQADLTTVQGLWQNFCHHIFFFASRQEALQWASGRDDIAILSLDEAHQLGHRLTAEYLAHGE